MKGLLKGGIFALVLVVLPLNAHAERESWYTYWGFGWSQISYSDFSNGSNLSDLRNDPGISSTSVSVDVLGFYFPVKDDSNLLVGFVANGVGERFENASGKFGSVQVNLAQIGLSLMNFFGTEPGDGFFIRGDLGATRLSITFNTIAFSGEDNSDHGLGASLGLGYGFPVTAGSRVLLNVLYNHSIIEEETFTNIQISVGGLF